MEGIPREFRGVPKHGEFMAASVACGQRQPDWEARYRAAVAAWVRGRARDAAEAEVVMRIVDDYAAYARRAVAYDRQRGSTEYCRWTANATDMAQGDAIVAGRARPQ
jgi:hypothetical protein